MWAGMSSGPSSVCVQYGASSGTASLNQDSKSSRTSGEAFSLSVSEADVWRMNTCSSPTRSSPSSGSASSTSRVTRWKPRGRGSQRDLALEPHGATLVRGSPRRRACRPARRGTARPRPPAARAGGRPWPASRRRARSGARARSGRRASRSTAAGEARRAGGDVAVGAHEALGRWPGCGRARARPVADWVHRAAVCSPAAWHVFDRRARPGDRRARRRGPVALVLRRLAVHLGAAGRRRGGHAVGRRAGPRARTRSTGWRPGDAAPAGARATLLAADPLAARAPGRHRRRAAGRVAVHTGAGCIAHAGHVDRRALELPGQHDGARHRARRHVAPRSRRPAATSPTACWRRSRPPRARAATCAGASRRRWSSCRAEGEPWRRAIDLRVEDHADPLDELRRLLGAPARLRAGRRGRRADGRRAAPRRPASSTARAAELAPESDELLFWAGLALAHAGDARRRASPPSAARPSGSRAGSCCSTACRRTSRPAGDAVRRALGAADGVRISRSPAGGTSGAGGASASLTTTALASAGCRPRRPSACRRRCRRATR